MARIELEFTEVQMRNEESGLPMPGVRATCTQCGECAESFGRGPRSRMRSLMQLKEHCDETDPATGRGHYYIDPDDDGGRLPDPVVKPWWEK